MPIYVANLSTEEFDERNHTRRELDAVRERFNALAVKVAKLEQENAALRANQLPAGAVCFVPTGEVRFPKEGEYFDAGDVLAVANFNFSTHEYPIYRRVEAQGAEPVKSQFPTQEYLATENSNLRDQCDRLVDQRDQTTAQLIAVESERDVLRQQVDLLKASRDYLERRSSMFEVESKANQEAADVLRLIEIIDPLSIELKTSIVGYQEFAIKRRNGERCDTGTSRLSTAVCLAAKAWGITLPAKDEQPKPMGYPELKRELDKLGVYIGKIIHTDRSWCGSVDGTSIITNSAEEYLAAARKCVAKTAPAPVTSPSPDVASGAEGGKRTGLIFECVNGPAVVEPIPNDSYSLQARYRVVRGYVVCGDFYTKTDADVWCSFINGTSPVHQQLAEARAEIERLRSNAATVIEIANENTAFREEIESLRRCREAWDAVRKHYMGLDRAWMNNGMWQASVPNIPEGVTFGRKCADPIEAVLELAKTLEKGG